MAQGFFGIRVLGFDVVALRRLLGSITKNPKEQ